MVFYLSHKHNHERVWTEWYENRSVGIKNDPNETQTSSKWTSCHVMAFTTKAKFVFQPKYVLNTFNTGAESLPCIEPIIWVMYFHRSWSKLDWKTRKIRPFKFQFSLDKSRRDKEKDPGVRAQESQFMLLREGQIDFAPEIMVNQKLMETLPQVGSLINFEICTAFLSDTS